MTFVSNSIQIIHELILPVLNIDHQVSSTGSFRTKINICIKSPHQFTSWLQCSNLCQPSPFSCWFWFSVAANKIQRKWLLLLPSYNPPNPSQPCQAGLLCSLEGPLTSQTPATIHRQTTKPLSINLMWSHAQIEWLFSAQIQYKPQTWVLQQSLTDKLLKVTFIYKWAIANTFRFMTLFCSSYHLF